MEELLEIGSAFRKTCKHGSVATVRLRVRQRDHDTVMRISGAKGDFARVWTDSDPDIRQAQTVEFKDTPLPKQQDLDSALRSAASMGDKAFGVVPFAMGFAVRVKAEHFEDTLGKLQEDSAAFTGSQDEEQGVPSFWGKTEVAEFFKAKNWTALPLLPLTGQRGTATWLLRAQVPPISKGWQYQDGMICVADHITQPRPTILVLPMKKRRQTEAQQPGSAPARHSQGDWTSTQRALDASSPARTQQRPRGSSSSLQKQMDEMQQAFAQSMTAMQKQMLQLSKIIAENSKTDSEDSDDEGAKESTSSPAGVLSVAEEGAPPTEQCPSSLGDSEQHSASSEH